jgi:hypothetical protein
MPNKIDLTGQRFGKLVVLSENGRASNGSVKWLCKCDCGNLHTVRSSHLRDGNVTSCGCKQKEVIPINPGERFGRLEVIERDFNTTEHSYKCRCDCGNIITVQAKYLRHLHTRSCGCLAKETSANNGKKQKIDMLGKRFGRLVVIKELPVELRTEKDHVSWLCQCDCGNTCVVTGYHLRRGDIASCGCLKRLDITNQKYGKLTALYRDEEFSNRHKYRHSFWKCKCDCGNEISVYLGHLQNGHTTSCGCDKSSRGEQEITQLLIDNDINFIHDKQYFKDLILPSGGIGRYDYIIFNEDNSIKCIIEFDGEQHYRDGWNSLEQVVASDKIKNEYAFFHQIPIIRIPYWEKGNITLDLLFSGTYELTPDMEEAQEEMAE